MTDNGNALRIIKVELVEQSLKTSRVLTGSQGRYYPLMMWFSRPVDAFERLALEDELSIKFDNDDPMCAIHFETTLEDFVDEIEVQGLNSTIDNAVANARHEREAAEAEDARLKALTEAINEKLKSQRG